MKRKPKIREFTSPPILFEVFGYEVRIIFTNDVSGSRGLRDEELGRDDGGEASAIHAWKHGMPYSYVFLPYSPTPGTIAHESWHVIRRMLDYCGAGLDNETVAYHLGYLVGQIHARVRRRKA